MQGASDYAQAQADLIRKQQQYLLDEAKRSEENRLKALETSNQQVIDKLNQNKVTVNENADNLNRQEYLSKMLNQEALNQNLSRYRIGTSGARETSLNDLYAQYGENVNKINTDRNQGLRDIDNQIGDTNLAYETNKNTALSEEALKRLQLQQSIDSQAQNRYSEAYQWYVQEEERKEALRQYEEEQKQIEREYQLKKEQLAQDRYQWQKEYELSLKQLAQSANKNRSKTYQVNTPYYQGNLNSDTKYGTFGTKDLYGVSYQPNNIGKDKYGNVQYLKSSGKKVKDIYGVGNVVGASGANLDNQTVWKYGKDYYIWDGSQNQYIKM